MSPTLIDDVIEHAIDLVELNTYEKIIQNELEELKRIKVRYSSEESPVEELIFLYYQHRMELINEFESEKFKSQHSVGRKLKVKLLIGRYKSYLVNKLEELKPGSTLKRIEKINWLAQPSHLAFIFKELAKKGYIELPTTRGDGSVPALGTLLLQLFELKRQTTDNYYYDCFSRETCNLSENTIREFTIPDYDGFKR